MRCHNCSSFNEATEVLCGKCRKPTGVPPYAGYWKRWGACRIDGAYLFALDFVIIVGAQIIGGFMNWLISDLILFLIILFALLIDLLYYVGFESSTYQATPGMKSVGIKVTDLKGNRISVRRATVRNFLKGIFGMGFLTVIFSKKKQGLHDMATGTILIHENFPKEGFDYLF